MEASEPRMIVIVAGLPGSGKSFFAERLAARLGYTHINSDRVRRSLHVSGRYSITDKLIVYKEMLAQTTRSVSENKGVVVDATFYHHSMREMFVRLADGFHLPVRVIELTANEHVARERLQKPRRYSEADFSVYQKLRDEFEEITMPHLTLESTNDNLDEMLKTAIIYLNSGKE